MSLFGSKIPALTRMAAEVSERVAALDPGRRQATKETIRHLVLAIRSMSCLTPEIMDVLFDVITTLMRKAGMRKVTRSDDDGEKDFAELKAGMSAELLEAIEAV